MSFLQDFKDFAFKGNLIDMAVGIVMGTAAGAIVKSFIDNMIAPLIAALGGVPDMSSLTIPLGEAEDAAALKYGSFIQNLIDFTILAFVIFIALKVASRWMKKAEKETPPPADVQLLTEIRDALVKNNG